MKFEPITETTLDEETLKAQLSAAHEIGRVHIGESVLFVKKRMRFFYISFSDIYRVFRRVKGVPARICCGKGEIRLEYVVLCSKSAEICEIDMPDERTCTAVIEELHSKAPDMKIGKKE